MRHAARRSYSLDDYWDVEAGSEAKHEYFDGEIFAMAGGTNRHNIIVGNVFAAIHAILRGSSCIPFSSDQRVTTPSGLYTYPDASVFCGDIETIFPPETALNPVALFEVLSDSTRDYDRTGKFELYESIATLRDYVLIEQSEMRVEHRTRDEAGWTMTILTATDDSLNIPALEIRVPLREIYERVSFDAE